LRDFLVSDKFEGGAKYALVLGAEMWRFEFFEVASCG
jgi:hypothetical protein